MSINNKHIMADFSKQWCEIYDPEMPWDFDIEVEADSIPWEHFRPMICEGFGFIGIGITSEGKIELIFPDALDEDKFNHVDYNTFISNQKLKSSGI